MQGPGIFFGGRHMEWMYLILAGIFEITWATTMKLSQGFSKALPTLIIIIGYIASAILLSMELKKKCLCDMDGYRYCWDKCTWCCIIS